MNCLPRERKVQVINGLCNGMSLRACSRVFNTHRTAIQRLLVRVGKRCDQILTEHMRDLDLEHLELDELWTFCGKKEGRLTPAEKLNPDLGDQYLFFAIDHKTKVVPAWAIGKRDHITALQLLYRLRGSLNGCRPQISTDAWAGYQETIGALFGDEGVDWATIQKEYQSTHPGRGRYAPPRVSKIRKRVELGTPDLDRAGTSIIERKNLTVRTMQRRFTRLTVAFSRKIENLRAACALHFAYYNFVWQPRTLGGPTPAIAADATKRLWSVADLVGDC